MAALRKMLAGLCFAGGPAGAEMVVALVIGKSAYPKVIKPPNPANDAAAVIAMLKAVVEIKLNLLPS